MTTPSVLNGQILGQAERSTRAVLDRLLAGTSTTFDQWVALNVTATTAPSGLGDVADRLAAGLRLPPVTARAVADGLVESGLLTGDARLTPAGQTRFAEISAGIADITRRLYADLPADDLETAGRVLSTITARAQAELATTS